MTTTRVATANRSRVSIRVTIFFLVRAGGMFWPCINILSSGPSLITVQNLVTVSHTVCEHIRGLKNCEHIRGPKISKTLEPAPCDRGVADPYTRLSPCLLPCHISSFQVKRYESNYADPLGKFDLLRLAFRSISRSLAPTRIDRLPMTS